MGLASFECRYACAARYGIALRHRHDRLLPWNHCHNLCRLETEREISYLLYPLHQILFDAMDSSQPSPPKRMRLAYHHKHKVQHGPQDLPPHEPSVLLSEGIDKLFLNSLKTICEEAAVEQGIFEPAVESVALQAIHGAAEEFTLQLCSKVRRSMIAARRSVPTATDFETAIRVLDIPRLDNQIKPYSTVCTINPSLPLTPPPDDAFHNHVELPASFLGPELSKQGDLKKFAFNTSSLPPLPSAHTYKDSAVYTSRETDSRKIRELATEEGKLGEQALRKLATAVKLDATLSAGPEVRTIRGKRGPRARRLALTEAAVFEETVRDLLSGGMDDFELGPIVTSEKVYRMPDDTRAKKRAAGAAAEKADKDIVCDPPSKYNLLPPPPPVGRKSSKVEWPDSMDVG